MKRLTFFDTNILFYAADPSDSLKQETAIRLVREHRKNESAVISLQVIQEYYAALTRKLKVPASVAQQHVEALCQFQVVRFHARDIVSAIELHRLHQISFWDALILHAARISGCSVVYSEDLQNQAVIASVRVVNPFL